MILRAITSYYMMGLVIFIPSSNCDMVSWKAKQIDTYGKRFSIYLATSNYTTRKSQLIALNDSLIVTIENTLSQDFTYTKSITSSTLNIDINYLHSVGKGKLFMTIQNSTNSSFDFQFDSLNQAIDITSYLVDEKDNNYSKYSAIGLKVVITVTGWILIFNTFFKLNGMLLLRFMQMMDLINFLDLLNVNTRETVKYVLKQLNQISSSKFLLFDIPIEFSKIPNKKDAYRGRLTQNNISPVLLENQLPETIFLVILFLIDQSASQFRCCKFGEKVSDLIRSLKFGFIECIFVEQFFYSCYQIVSAYNYKSTSFENWISLGCAFLSLYMLVNEVMMMFQKGLNGYLIRDVEVKKPIDIKPTKPWLDIDDFNPKVEKAPVHKMDENEHIKEFIESDIMRTKLNLRPARLYNLLFQMRLIVISLACLLVYNNPYYQLSIITSFNLYIFILTVRGSFTLKFFASKWISFQRVLQETLITLIFIMMTIFSIDSKKYLLSLKLTQIISFFMITCLGLIVISEVVFFILNFAKSIVLSFIFLWKGLKKCCSKKHKESEDEDGEINDSSIHPIRPIQPSISRVLPMKKIGLSINNDKKLKNNISGNSDQLSNEVDGEELKKADAEIKGVSILPRASIFNSIKYKEANDRYV